MDKKAWWVFILLMILLVIGIYFYSSADVLTSPGEMQFFGKSFWLGWIIAIVLGIIVMTFKQFYKK